MRILTILFILLLSSSSYAGHTLVLIHGYLSDGSAWRPTGIVRALEHTGWRDAGHLFPNAQSGVAVRTPLERYVYTVTLPSEAPLAVQAQWLDFYLRKLQVKHPNNSLILVGHSAGGLVARLVMVVSDIARIQGLLTIATPHLGTDKAELGAGLGNSPLGLVAPFFGLDTINRSQGLYHDLVREYPTSLLFWLNRQPHPSAFYVSVVRAAGDEWVPAYSQDMNDVPALRGLAKTVTSPGRHRLQPADGPLLASLLARFLK